MTFFFFSTFVYLVLVTSKTVWLPTKKAWVVFFFYALLVFPWFTCFWQRFMSGRRGSGSCVCVVHIKLIFPPIYIQHNQRPYRGLLQPRETSDVVTNYTTEITLFHVQHGGYGHAMPTAASTRAKHTQPSTPGYSQGEKKRQEQLRSKTKRSCCILSDYKHNKIYEYPIFAVPLSTQKTSKANPKNTHLLASSCTLMLSNLKQDFEETKKRGKHSPLRRNRVIIRAVSWQDFTIKI